MTKRTRTGSKWTALAMGGATALAMWACAPSSGTKDNGTGPSVAAGGVGGGFGGMGTGTGSIPTFGSGGATTFNVDPDSGRGLPNPNECFGTAQKPETIYVDAMVTDTLVTYSPIALNIMMDRSSSMVGVLGDATSWPNATAAVTAFVQDTRSAGIDVGLSVFPEMGATESCDGSLCSAPVVPIAVLPGNAQAMINGMSTAAPTTFPILLTPTECAIRGMLKGCQDYSAAASGEQCVAVLVTDGSPTQCNGDIAALSQIIADARGATPPILTFVIGLPGSNINNLNQFAVAGGTNAAINVGSGAAGQQTFIDALNSIRGSVSTSETHAVTRAVTKPLDCQWRIPTAPGKETFDKNKVNVKFTPPGGAPTEAFGHLASDNPADCAAAQGDAWYYDDAIAPTQVLVCENTCNKLKAAVGGAVNIEFGCLQVPAKLR